MTLRSRFEPFPQPIFRFPKYPFYFIWLGLITNDLDKSEREFAKPAKLPGDRVIARGT